MMLKVGQIYRVIWGGELKWAGITKINLFASKIEIHFTIVPRRLSHWLWWLPIWLSASSTAQEFVYSMDRATKLPIRSASEIEVEYP